MANKINSLLSKKGWSGEEVGRAAVNHLIEDFISLSKPEKKPSLSKEDIQRLIDSLTTDYDKRAFNNYNAIVNLLSDLVLLSQTYEQQFYNGFYRLVAEVSSATFAATTYTQTSNAPIILTQSQYDKYYEEAKQELTELKISPASLFHHALSYFKGDYNEKGKRITVPKDIKAIAAEMKKKPFKDKDIFAKLAEANGDGYYLFSDGTRSDELSDEEYKTKLTEEGGKAPLSELKDDEYYKEYLSIRQEQMEKRRAGKTLQEIMNEDNGDYPKWIYETDLPEDVTEWDIVFGDYNNALEDVFFYGCEDIEKSYSCFMKLFPDISAAIIKYLSGKGEKIKALFTGKYKPDEEVISWGELAALKVMNYEYMITPHETDIRDRYNEGRPEHEKTSSFCVAIIKEGRFSENFKNPIFNANKSLIDQFTEPITDIYRVKLIEPALKLLYAYHFIFSFIDEVYDFPGLSALMPDIATYESKISGLNGLIVVLYDAVKEDENKTKIVIEGARPISINDVKPSEEARKKAINIFKTGKITHQTLNDLVEALTDSGEGAADDE